MCGLWKVTSVSNCSVIGVHTIAYAYPNVKIVTAAVDPEVNDKFHIIPGIGEQIVCNWLSSENPPNFQLVLLLAEFYPQDGKESSLFSCKAWYLINDLYANNCDKWRVRRSDVGKTLSCDLVTVICINVFQENCWGNLTGLPCNRL